MNVTIFRDMPREIQIVSMGQVEERAIEGGIDLSQIDANDLRTVDFKGDRLSFTHALLIKVEERIHQKYDEDHPYDLRNTSRKRLIRRDIDS